MESINGGPRLQNVEQQTRVFSHPIVGHRLQRLVFEGKGRFAPEQWCLLSLLCQVSLDRAERRPRAGHRRPARCPGCSLPCTSRGRTHRFGMGGGADFTDLVKTHTRLYHCTPGKKIIKQHHGIWSSKIGIKSNKKLTTSWEVMEVTQKTPHWNSICHASAPMGRWTNLTWQKLNSLAKVWRKQKTSTKNPLWDKFWLLSNHLYCAIEIITTYKIKWKGLAVAQVPALIHFLADNIPMQSWVGEIREVPKSSRTWNS